MLASTSRNVLTLTCLSRLKKSDSINFLIEVFYVHCYSFLLLQDFCYMTKHEYADYDLIHLIAKTCSCRGAQCLL